MRNRMTRAGTVVLFIILTASSGSASSSFKVPCYIRSVTCSSATICWQGSGNGPGRLVYGSTDAYGKTAEGKPGPVNCVTISGLAPRTKIYYNIRTGANLRFPDQEAYHFFTAPREHTAPFVLAVLGDTRAGKEAFGFDHQAVVNSIRRHTFPEFFLHTGDLVDVSYPACWQDLFGVQGPLLAQAPLYPVRGNSDGDGAGQIKYFRSPGDSLWFSFSYGGLYLIGLDVLNGKSDTYYRRTLGPGSTQYRWLKARLASPERLNKSFTLVYFHAPLFPPDGKGSSYLQQLLPPMFEHYNVDLVLNGQHYFSYSQAGGVTYVVSGGGGAALDKPREILSPHVRVYRPVFHHLRLQVQYPALTIEAADNQGTVFFNHSLISQQTTGGYGKTGDYSPAVLPGSQTLPEALIFGTAECRDCSRLRQEIGLVLDRHFGKGLCRLRFFNVDEPAALEKYRQLESARAEKKHTFPVLVLNNRFFSGPGLSMENLDSLVTDILKQQDPNPRSVTILVLIISLCGIAFLVLVIYIKRKRSAPHVQ